MTLSRTTLPIPSPSDALPTENHALRDEARGEWRYFAATVAILAIAYLLLQNGQWVSGPDTSFYIAVARNLALDRGFIFNGGAVGRIPPLWPLTLAAGMEISSSFWFLNLIPMIGMLGASAAWYWVLRRFAAPARAMAAVVLSGLLFFSYTASTQLRTEGMFCLYFSSAILLAMQIGEGKKLWWRLPLLMLLCAAMVLQRWAGLVAWFAVGMALINGWRTSPRSWIVLALSLAANIGSFALIRYVLTRLPAPEPMWVIEQGKKGPRIPDEDGEGPAKLHSITTSRGMIATLSSMADSGKWITSVLWMPFYLGVTNAAVGTVTNIIGWMLIGLCALVAWRDVRQGKWLWIGAMLYCAGMIFRVKMPNPRYLVPVAPLIVLGVWLGLEHLVLITPRDSWRKVSSFVAKGILLSVAVCNIGLWAVDVYINRSPNFYDRYRAGEVSKIIAAAQYMRERGVKDGQISVSVYYMNLGRERMNGAGLRAMAMLTDRGVRGSPKGTIGEPNEVLLEWAKQYDVKYYLYRTPTSPWRALHFKVRWLQEWLTGKKDIPEYPGWILYEIHEGGVRPVELPAIKEMTRVPGFEPALGAR